MSKKKNSSYGLDHIASFRWKGIRWHVAMSIVAVLCSFAALRADIVINEIVAVNRDGLLDEDGDSSDWIELKNTSVAAVNLEGFFLSDDPAVPNKWRFPSIELEAESFLVVFASGKDRRDPNASLHTSFRLEENGETLLLINPDGDVVDLVPYPRQRSGFSYGLSDGAQEVLVGPSAAVRFLAPSPVADSDWPLVGFDDATWTRGTSGLGFSPRGIVVDPSNIAPDGLASQSSDFNASLGADRANDEVFGNFTATASGDANPFWEVDLGDSHRLADIVIHNRGDGCCQSRLRDIVVTIRDQAGEEVWESLLLNPENVLGGGGTAGPDSLALDLVELAGGVVDGRWVRVARVSDPDLSGTGGVGNADEVNVLSIGEVEIFESGGGFPGVRTDVEEEMQGSSSLLMRYEFSISDANSIDQLDATIRYDDGFVAYLNGVEIARVNAPGDPGDPVSFSATALVAQESDEGSLVELDLTDSVDLLLDGENLLAVHGLNVAANDDDFLMVAELIAQSGGTAFRHFENPTPGEANDSTGVLGFVSDTTFSLDRGLYDRAIDVAIRSDTEGAVIVFTRDGSEPTTKHGEIYTGPVRVDETTTLRAFAHKTGYRSTDVDTHSYLYLSDILDQPTLLSDIVDDARLGEEVRAALGAIPSVHVTTRSSIPSTSEVPATVELILPDGSRGFHIDAGIKRVGGHSLGAYPKNNMRIYFRREYGAGKLRYPLFDDLPYGEGAIEEFDRLNLRSGSHDSVFYLGNNQQLPSNAQYVRNRFMNDMQLEMGQLSIRGRFVHVYLNGSYHGHYQLIESPSAAHVAEYSGGKKDDYEAVRRGSPIGSASPAWNAIRGIRGNWAEVQRRVDIPNFVDYMLLNYWGGNAWDWRTAQNWAAAGPSNPDLGGYRFLCWDSDIVMRRTDDNNLSIGGPDNLFSDLMRLDEFRLAVADGIERHFFHSGLLTPDRAFEVYSPRAEEVRDTLIAESARWRWGGRRWLPEDQWQDELDRLRDDFFPRRTQIVIDQMSRAGWFLDVESPDFRIDGRPQFGGWVERGASLTMSADSDGGSFEDSFFVELDSPAQVLVPENDALGQDWIAVDYALGSNGESWRTGTNGVGYDTGSSYDDAIAIDVSDEMTGAEGNTSVFVRLVFQIDSAETLAAVTELRLDMRSDDGFVAYLNGREVADQNSPVDVLWNSRATAGSEADLDRPISYDVSHGIAELRVGENLLAIHGLNSSTNSSDMLILAELVAREFVPGGGGGPEISYTVDGSDPRDAGAVVFDRALAIQESVIVKARAREDGDWSALRESTFAVDEGLRITEMMYHPVAPPEGSPFIDEDYEFVELTNMGLAPILLDGYSLGGAIQFEFSDLEEAIELEPGGVIVLVEDSAGFADRYSTPIAGQYSGRLSNSGERLILRGPVGEEILEIDYDPWWDVQTDGAGPSLVIVDPSTSRSAWGEEANWRASDLPLGSPGLDESSSNAGLRRPGDINEDGGVDISDPIALLRSLFIAGARAVPCGDGNEPTEGTSIVTDVNGDGGTNLTDAISLLDFLFRAGAPPALGERCVPIVDCSHACES